jgi:KDO2-lipid IV(A) lauroyltransferase
MKWLYRVSTLLYYPLYYVFGYRKKVVFENLHIVFPEKTSEERKNIAKKFYRHLCDMLVESIKTLSISEEEIIKRFAFTNIEEIKNIEKENKSIILMCAHYASWEWIFIMQKYVNHKGYAIYKRLANAYFDRLVQRIRAKYDTHLVTTKETFEILTKSKEIGELTINGFLSDQSPKKDKAFHWSEFMGVKVPVHTGAELLAKRLDMAVVYFLVKKLKRGHYETTFTTITLNPNEYKDYEITDIFTKALEEQIREAPEFYLWTHKRWKHRDNIPEQFQ